ncbi:DUF4276 family protein [Halostreptopolyspora alba]|uniref:DUF4276 family protein n=1 Tax=Halostreptopolyspora alba TaxID=2487137 RepID=A0A3N0EDY4_9ACTN|nr:DUF4276 family protein [Nocardiopsaceae bacterium YIM 96095]
MKSKTRRGGKSEIQLEVLVEEDSAHRLLSSTLGNWIPGNPNVRFGVRKFRGKPDLLEKLPRLLSGYAEQRRKGADVRVVVLVDQDEDNCAELKEKMECRARESGLNTPSQAGNEGYSVVNRIAVRELENWYFGDWKAVQSAFPKVKETSPEPYRSNADATTKKTSDAFGRILRSKGIRNQSKPDWAARIAPNLEPERNRSASFKAFLQGVRDLVNHR